MQDRRIESVLQIAKKFNRLPSEILHIDDEYTAFCFDEACCQILIHLENGEKPTYIERKKEEPKEYKGFTDFYKEYNGGK